METVQKVIWNVGWCDIKLFKNKTEKLLERKTPFNLKKLERESTELYGGGETSYTNKHSSKTIWGETNGAAIKKLDLGKYWLA